MTVARRGAMRLPSVALLVALLVVACGGSPASPSPTQVRIDGIEWRAVSVPGAAIVPNHVPTLRIDGAQAVGSTGCNSYGATISIDGSAVQVGDIGQTEMACAGRGVMELESAFVAALRSARQIGVREGRLVLAGTLGELVFEAPPG